MKSKFLIIWKCIKHINKKTLKELIVYVKRKGPRGVKLYIYEKVKGNGKPYDIWFSEHKISNKELEQQRNIKFLWRPKISIVVPVYKTPLKYLSEMIESVKAQSYANWELCIAEASEKNDEIVRTLEEYVKNDKRIKFTVLAKNEGIAGNTNHALELATGDYVGFLDHDDYLAPNSLYEIVKELQEERYDVLYTDEDMVNGNKHCTPIFKPDFSIDLLRSHNYITHFFVVKKKIEEKTGGLNKEYDGAQDYDFVFRCIEQAKSIKHISKVLYHWRIHENSVAGNPESKLYAYEAGKKAIQAHLDRMNVKASVESMGLWGMYHVVYDTPGNPLISIIIPNKDHKDDLNKCIESIIKKSTYSNFEIIIVENNSMESETFLYYQQITQTYNCVKVIEWKKEFNYAAINNFGVKHSKGEYLLFLNNDTELLAPNALKEMLGICMRNEVGAVGAKLLYGDDTVQHAGVVIGFGNYAGHVNTNIKRNDCGYMNRALINCNYSAVTGACLMTKKELFKQVDGFDEQFKVACNDVDYCLKLRELKKLIVYNAFSEWYHYESKSRGYEDTKEKQARFMDERKRFQKKWNLVLEKGDPYYNKNFSLLAEPFKLK
ncbi:Chondroitin polymerase [uncultured Dorea sp.]|uniref:glycosyltransferase family 2 protein n=1 Tax=Dorea formicigenerans TaxID=39486 RepID=UPI000821E59C|nr:glycosyltransferase family 2 protein [uncultured Dorea sp.]SCH26398.1 Chondroitin polymerase [uncultured Dorea sp.]